MSLFIKRREKRGSPSTKKMDSRHVGNFLHTQEQKTMKKHPISDTLHHTPNDLIRKKNRASWDANEFLAEVAQHVHAGKQPVEQQHNPQFGGDCASLWQQVGVSGIEQNHCSEDMLIDFGMKKIDLILKDETIHLLKDELHKKSHQLEDMTSKIDAEEHDIETLSEELKVRNEIIENAESQLIDEQTQVIGLNTMIEKLNSMLQQNEKQIRDQTDQITCLKHDLQQAKDALEEKNEHMVWMSKELEKTQDQFILLSDDLEDMLLQQKSSPSKKRKSGPSGSKKRMDADMLGKNHEVRELRKQLEKRNTIIEALSKDFMNRQTSFCEQKQQFDMVQQTAMAKEKRIQSQDQLIVKLHADLDEKNKLIASNEHLLSSLRRSLDIAKADFENLQTELTTRHLIIQKLTKQCIEQQTDSLQHIHAVDIMQDQLNDKNTLISLLKAQQENLELTISSLKEAIPSAVIMLDKSNNVIQWNEQAEKAFHFGEQTHMGSPFFSMFIMDDNRLQHSLELCQKEKKTMMVESICMNHEGGSSVLANVREVPILGGHGELEGTLLVIDDVSKSSSVAGESTQSKQSVPIASDKFAEVNTKLQLNDPVQNVGQDEKTVLTQKQLGVPSTHTDKQTIESLCEHLKLIEEINTCLGIRSEALKTKKLDDEAE